MKLQVSLLPHVRSCFLVGSTKFSENVSFSENLVEPTKKQDLTCGNNETWSFIGSSIWNDVQIAIHAVVGREPPAAPAAPAAPVAPVRPQSTADALAAQE